MTGAVKHMDQRQPQHSRPECTRSCVADDSTDVGYNGLSSGTINYGSNPERNCQTGRTTMNISDLVVPAGGGSVWEMAPGRSAALKVTSKIADSVMMFEEVAPTDTV